ncbi:MAG: GNAT family N-acetyltransferase [Candidatus Korobacteraceae bacterium]
MPPPPSSIAIRKAIITDASGILHCLGAAFEPYRSAYTPGAYLDTVLTPETVGERLQSMCVFVAVSAADDTIVGTIACAMTGANEGHLRGMAVLPDWQGSGVAARLLHAAEEELVRRQCSRITLDTTEPLERAMRFYEKYGYRRSGKTSNFFGMPLHEYQKDL